MIIFTVIPTSIVPGAWASDLKDISVPCIGKVGSAISSIFDLLCICYSFLHCNCHDSQTGRFNTGAGLSVADVFLRQKKIAGSGNKSNQLGT